MPNTPNLTLPYPLLTDAPNGPANLQALATAVDTNVGGIWTGWSPALTAATTNPTLGAASGVSGRYMQIGKTVTGWGKIVFGTSGTNAGSGSYIVSVPVAISALGGVNMRLGSWRINCAGLFTEGELEYLTAGTLNLQYGSTQVGGTGLFVTNALPGAWAANNYIWYQFTYEAA